MIVELNKIMKGIDHPQPLLKNYEQDFHQNLAFTTFEKL